MDLPLLDLERCSFLRPTESADEIGAGPADGLRCWASEQLRAVGTEEQRRRCLTVLHASCPALLRVLESFGGDSWSASGRAARIVAESCHLAEARLEVRAEELGPALARIFGGD